MNEQTTVVTVHLVIIDPQGLLLFERRCNTGYMDGFCQFCTGDVEIGEPPIEAVKRMAKEGLGVEIAEPIKLIHVLSRPEHDETGNRIDLYFEIERWKGRLKINHGKSDQMLWVNTRYLPDKTLPHVRVAIEATLAGEFFSQLDLGWMRAQAYNFAR